MFDDDRERDEVFEEMEQKLDELKKDKDSEEKRREKREELEREKARKMKSNREISLEGKARENLGKERQPRKRQRPKRQKPVPGQGSRARERPREKQGTRNTQPRVSRGFNPDYRDEIREIKDELSSIRRSKNDFMGFQEIDDKKARIAEAVDSYNTFVSEGAEGGLDDMREKYWKAIENENYAEATELSVKIIEKYQLAEEQWISILDNFRRLTERLDRNYRDVRAVNEVVDKIKKQSEELVNEIRDELTDETEDFLDRLDLNVSGEIEAKMKEAISSFGEDFRDELTEEMKKDLKDDISSELSGEIGELVGEKVKFELKKQLPAGSSGGSGSEEEEEEEVGDEGSEVDEGEVNVEDGGKF